MSLNGASQRFVDQHATKGPLSAENLNSLDMGGNVYASAVGGLKVDVSPIAGLNNATAIDYAGVTEQSLTGGATNYIYINSAGALTINTSGFPSYPGTKYFPLAVVVCGASTITSITDKRWKFYT